MNILLVDHFDMWKKWKTADVFFVLLLHVVPESVDILYFRQWTELVKLYPTNMYAY